MIKSKEWKSQETIERLEGSRRDLKTYGTMDWINNRVGFVISDIDYGYWELWNTRGQYSCQSDLHYRFDVSGSRRLKESIEEELGDHVREMVIAAIMGKPYQVEIDGKRYTTRDIINNGMRLTLAEWKI